MSSTAVIIAAAAAAIRAIVDWAGSQGASVPALLARVCSDAGVELDAIRRAETDARAREAASRR